MKQISIGAEKNPEKEYIVCVRYKAHCSIDAAANLEDFLQNDEDFVQIEAVRDLGTWNKIKDAEETA